MPTITTTITSRTGTSQLNGRSGYSSTLNPYDSENPSAWEGQGLKWRTVSQSGSLQRIIYQGAGVSCSKPVYDNSNGTWTGSTTESGGVFNYALLTATGSYTGGLANQLRNQYDINDAVYSHNDTVSKFLVNGTNLCNLLNSGTGSYFRGIGSAYEFLTEETSYYDSLATAINLVTGTSSQASSVSIDLTTPASDDPIDFEVTAVRLSILIDGAKDTPHLVTINLIDSNDFLLTSTFILTTDDSQISGQGTGQASFNYDVTQPPVGKTISFLSATVREAYPERVLTVEERLALLESP